MNYLTLLVILNEFCFGMYDFAYLRKDFKTGPNVGYGFVNFCHTDGFVNFWHTNGVLAILDNMANRQRPGHTSNRPCEISYATVQGLRSRAPPACWNDGGESWKSKEGTALARTKSLSGST
ncbi:hypothetical protein BCR34DRAFT_597109 [Clohesyomyces aquaticus]|uniref:Mei2-like C-terminal RNA recognition motif domain-containing protein n=1 Tax=Clohesyomyces aquaticus TaxID=1231657 RepID=A0A1Y2A499_9PLEO|nr:hypothetical protein BCR34DRAFT_597109 [Clohesyomyces aquaticus]